MLEKNTINFYETKIDLKQVIVEQNLSANEEALYVCDLYDVKEKYENWQKLMSRIKPYYAVKCNDDPQIIKSLAELGTNFDCASKAEIKQVLDLGVQPERIIFAHPCKMLQHVEYAKAMGVKTTTVDTEFEIQKLHQYYPESNLVIRIRCDAKNALSLFGKKFGCDPETEAKTLMQLAKSLNLKVIGISFHVGSGCNDLPAYDRAISFTKNLFEYGSTIGYDMNLLDIGGGFSGCDMQKFKEISVIINQSLMRNFPSDRVNIIAEPGRYFVESSCTLICKIHAKREARLPNGQLLSKQYYLNAGVFGPFIYVMSEPADTVVQHFVNEQHGEVPKFSSILWGPTCDSADKIVENKLLPDLQCGDFLAFPNMGAYTIPLACRFNGFMLQKIAYYDKIRN